MEQIDHVELFVPNRHDAAAWYHNVLGMTIVPEFEFWANDPKGPLMISTPTGGTKLALFAGEPQGSKRGIGFHLVAFRTSAQRFVDFVARLPDLKLHNRDNCLVSVDMIADHDLAFSVYFCDPYGHQFEVTTYEYEQTAELIEQMRSRNPEQQNAEDYSD